MGYFLLGRDADTVRLVSPSLFDSRQAALAELSRISTTGGSPVPDEVFVVDLDSATPVLIVSAAASAPPAEEAAVEETHAIIVETPSEAVDASVWEAPSEPEPEPEVAPELEPEPEFEPARDEEPPVDSAIADAIVADIEPQTEAEESPLPLHDALRRAAGALESSGIVPPDSVLPAGNLPAPDLEPSPAAGWPWDAALSSTEAPPAEEPAAAELPAEEPASEEPAPEQPAEYVPDPLEEPSLDDGDLIRAADSDSEEFESRPVIMGAYDEAPPHVTDPASVLPPEPLVPSPVEPAPPAPPIEEPVGESAGEPDDAVSGLLADLEEIPVASPAHDQYEASLAPESEPKPYEAGESDLSELKCDDCVYLNTCPKRGDSRPSDCGSFQWRTV